MITRDGRLIVYKVNGKVAEAGRDMARCDPVFLLPFVGEDVRCHNGGDIVSSNGTTSLKMHTRQDGVWSEAKYLVMYCCLVRR